MGVSELVMVGVSLGVVVTVPGVNVKGIGVIVTMPGVKVKGSDVTVPKIMTGVAVTIPGVRVGMVVHTGNGCGFTLQSMHAESKKGNTMKASLFFIFGLLVCLIVSCLGLLKNSFALLDVLSAKRIYKG